MRMEFFCSGNLQQSHREKHHQKWRVLCLKQPSDNIHSFRGGFCVPCITSWRPMKSFSSDPCRDPTRGTTGSIRTGSLGVDNFIQLLKPGRDRLNFFRKPTWMAPNMAPTAGGGLAVAIEEGPVGGEPELAPEGVLLQDGLAQRLGVGRKFR